MTDIEQTFGTRLGRRWGIWICMVWLLSRVATGYAGLENPIDDGEYSGVGYISGWKCEADGALTARINGGEAIPLAYLNDRPDTLPVCGDTDNGFISIVNWARYGTGTHIIEVFDNGVSFGRRIFHVTTLGEEFVRGARDDVFLLEDWPFDGDASRIIWNQAMQNFVIVDYADDATMPLCTTKTKTLPDDSGNLVTWTVTNLCDGKTLDIDVSRVPDYRAACSRLEISRFSSYTPGRGIQYLSSYAPGRGIQFRDRDTQGGICGSTSGEGSSYPDGLPQITKHTRVTVDETNGSLTLTFLEPFEVWYAGVRIAEFHHSSRRCE